MSKPERNLPRITIEKLVEQAFFEKMMAGNNPVNAQPGDMINSLGPVKRHILTGLKSEDIDRVRWPRV